jgi:hypothetical protein
MGYKMEKLLLLIVLAIVLTFAGGTGCKDTENNESCYEGKIVSLNNGDGCHNIIEITGTNGSGQVPKGTKITFDPKLSEKALDLGDIVYFKVLSYKEFVSPSYAICLQPHLAAQVAFCND